MKKVGIKSIACVIAVFASSVVANAMTVAEMNKVKVDELSSVQMMNMINECKSISSLLLAEAKTKSDVGALNLAQVCDAIVGEKVVEGAKAVKAADLKAIKKALQDAINALNGVWPSDLKKLVDAGSVVLPENVTVSSTGVVSSTTGGPIGVTTASTQAGGGVVASTGDVLWDSDKVQNTREAQARVTAQVSGNLQAKTGSENESLTGD